MKMRLSNLPLVGEKREKLLENSELNSFRRIAKATPEDLISVCGSSLSESDALAIIRTAKQYRNQPLKRIFKFGVLFVAIGLFADIAGLSSIAKSYYYQKFLSGADFFFFDGDCMRGGDCKINSPLDESPRPPVDLHFFTPVAADAPQHPLCLKFSFAIEFESDLPGKRTLRASLSIGEERNTDGIHYGAQQKINSGRFGSCLMHDVYLIQDLPDWTVHRSAYRKGSKSEYIYEFTEYLPKEKVSLHFPIPLTVNSELVSTNLAKEVYANVYNADLNPAAFDDIIYLQFNPVVVNFYVDDHVDSFEIRLFNHAVAVSGEKPLRAGIVGQQTDQSSGSFFVDVLGTIITKDDVINFKRNGVDSLQRLADREYLLLDLKSGRRIQFQDDVAHLYGHQIRLNSIELSPFQADCLKKLVEKSNIDKSILSTDFSSFNHIHNMFRVYAMARRQFPKAAAKMDSALCSEINESGATAKSQIGSRLRNTISSNSK